MYFWFSGPVYFEIGLIILLEALCSIICADHPDVLAITKIGVKNYIINKLLQYEYRTDGMHQQNRSRGQGKFSSSQSSFTRCFLKYLPKEVYHMVSLKVLWNILLQYWILDHLFYIFCAQIPSQVVFQTIFIPAFCLIHRYQQSDLKVSSLIHSHLHVKVHVEFLQHQQFHYRNHSMWKQQLQLRTQMHQNHAQHKESEIDQMFRLSNHQPFIFVSKVSQNFELLYHFHQYKNLSIFPYSGNDTNTITLVQKQQQASKQFKFDYFSQFRVKEFRVQKRWFSSHPWGLILEAKVEEFSQESQADLFLSLFFCMLMRVQFQLGDFQTKEDELLLQKYNFQRDLICCNLCN